MTVSELRIDTQPSQVLSPAPTAAGAGTRTPHVVIIGGGFGGLTAATALAGAPVRITLIDRRNHHLFQPLLYQVATAGLSPAQIATPIRSVLRDQEDTTVLMEEVTGIDAAGRAVLLGEKRIPFDYLIVATGARHSYFGHDEWEPFAPGLKTLEDATEIRRRMLLAFERAEAADDKSEQQKLLTFVVIGGGPTGVELAGKMIDVARLSMRKDFRNFDCAETRVILIEAGKRLLAAFSENLSRIARKRLEALGVEVYLDQAVTSCDGEGVTVGGDLLPAATIVWAAGVAASPAARWLGVPADRASRAIVDGNLNVPGHSDIFVIGDTAAARNADGKPVPGLAAAAKQQGNYVANTIRDRMSGVGTAPFAYTSFGNLAMIGRDAAVMEFGRFHLTGSPAWVLWSLAHIYFLIGFRNRFTVALDWVWSTLTYRRSARLITGRD